MSSTNTKRDDRLIDQTAKDILNGKTEQQVKESIAMRLARDMDDPKVEKIYSEGRRESGVDVKVYEPTTTNTKVVDSYAKEVVKETVQAIEEGKDADEEINKAAEKLRKKDLNENQVFEYLGQIFSALGFDSVNKEDITEGEKELSTEDDIIPLPQLDIEFNEPRNMNLRNQYEDDIIPSVDKPLLTEQNRVLSQKMDNGEISNDEILRTGQFVVETEKLEDFIRQLKVVVIALPPVCSKITVETYLVNYLNVIPEKFNGIYIFGWETQRNTDYYKSFDDIVKMNQELTGSLFVIRDIKTFNVLASDILKGIPRNYYLILWNGIFTTSDLVVVENYTGQTNVLWPGMMDMGIIYDLETDVSYIYGSHEEYYKKGISSTYERPPIGAKESWSSEKLVSPTSLTARVSRDRLNVYLDYRTNEYIPKNYKKQTLSGFSGSGINVDEALKRSPKFRNIIITLLSNSESRVLLKLPPGDFGIKSFLYIFERVIGQVKNGSTKMEIMSKPVILTKEESYEVKRDKVKSLPKSGPVLVITDFTLTDQLIPNDINKFYISGGGEYHDMETIMDLSKAENCLVDRYPRTIEIKNFITRVSDSIIESIDEIEYSSFRESFVVFQSNQEKLKRSALHMSLREDRLIVRKSPY
jgi:hypothetical protein